MNVEWHRQDRIEVDVDVTLTTVLDTVDARIVDLSQEGCRIVGASMATGDGFQIEYLGQTVFARCAWAEVDRMGCRFPFGLGDGPLLDALMLAAEESDMVSARPVVADVVARDTVAAMRRRSFGRRIA